MQRDPTRLTASDIDALLPMLRIGLVGKEGTKAPRQQRPQTAALLRSLSATYTQKLGELGASASRLKPVSASARDQTVDALSSTSDKIPHPPNQPPSMTNDPLRKLQDEELGITEEADDNEDEDMSAPHAELDVTSVPTTHITSQGANTKSKGTQGAEVPEDLFADFLRFSNARETRTGTVQHSPLVETLAPRRPQSGRPTSSAKATGDSPATTTIRSDSISRLYVRPATAGVFRPPSESRRTKHPHHAPDGYSASIAHRARPLTASQVRALEATTLGTAPVVQPYVVNSLATVLSGSCNTPRATSMSRPVSARPLSASPIPAKTANPSASKSTASHPACCFSPRMPVHESFYGSQRHNAIGPYLTETKKLVYSESLQAVAAYIERHKEERAVAAARLEAQIEAALAEEAVDTGSVDGSNSPGRSSKGIHNTVTGNSYKRLSSTGPGVAARYKIPIGGGVTIPTPEEHLKEVAAAQRQAQIDQIQRDYLERLGDTGVGTAGALASKLFFEQFAQKPVSSSSRPTVLNAPPGGTTLDPRTNFYQPAPKPVSVKSVPGKAQNSITHQAAEVIVRRRNQDKSVERLTQAPSNTLIARRIKRSFSSQPPRPSARTTVGV